MELDLFSGPEEPEVPKIWEVGELTDSIKGLLEQRIGDIKVSGEISNFRRQSSGHCYFSLKDETAQLQAVMFRSDAERVAFNPADGDQVVATGLITVYKPRGNYQIRVRSLRPKGQGSLQARFEALKEKLKGEGLFDDTEKKPIPVFPVRIGVVTSPTGAAIRDFLHVLHRRCPHIQVVLGPVRVQGDGAADEIARMVEIFNQRADVDVVVLTRGGGSLEDLWAFNEEVVARAVAASSLPVISAVGHEVDFSISDFVADLRAPTPSSAAELVARSGQEWRDLLGDIRRRLIQHARYTVETRAEILRRYRSHYVFREPVRVVEGAMQRVDEIRERLYSGVLRSVRLTADRLERSRLRWEALGVNRLLEPKVRHLDSIRRQLALLSPQGVLERGYSLTFARNGKLVCSVRSLEPGTPVQIRLGDGTMEAEIVEVTEGTDWTHAGKKLDGD